MVFRIPLFERKRMGVLLVVALFYCFDCFFVEVLLHYRVGGACPVTTDENPAMSWCMLHDYGRLSCNILRVKNGPFSRTAKKQDSFMQPTTWQVHHNKSELRFDTTMSNFCTSV